MKSFGLLLLLATCPAVAEAQPHHASSSDQAIYQNLKDMRWEKIMPELGDRSPEIVILHVDPKTNATKLMIRTPANFHVTKHWHTANETHTVVSGTFIMEHQGGERHELTAGAFNYVPAKTVHQAWTKPNEDALLFITVDGAWDVNWVEGPPKPQN